MGDTNKHPGSAAELRRQAEETALGNAAQLMEDLEALPPSEMRRMLFELRVHKIELEMQNEELRRAQLALEASQSRYFDLYDLAPVGYVTVSEEGLILEANLTTATLLGVSHAELVQQPLTRFILREDQDKFYLHRKQITELGSPQSRELRMVRPDGTAFWAHLDTAAAQAADGSPLFHIVVSDIAERKQVEEALRKSEHQYEVLASKIRVGVYILRSEPGGTYTFDYASHRMAEIFETSVGSLLSDAEAVPRAIHPDDLDSLSSTFREGILGQRPFDWNGRALVGGAVKWLHFESSPEPLASGDIQWHGFVVDITERKQLDAEKEELVAQNHQLQKAESLARMAGAIAHHFNNKLQSIMANLELLGGPPIGVDPARCLTMAMRATEKAAEVSRLMLLYLGQTTSRREPRFLSELCSHCLPLVQETLPDTATLETDWPAPGPVINANENEILQVLANLVSNAWEALDDGRGRIRISVKSAKGEEIPATHRFPAGWQAVESDYACLEVRDSGCGIADADIEKLFDPFYSTKFISRGLGLSVVLGIVHAHDGVVTVESQQGQYCAFRLYFPVSEDAPRLPEIGAQAPAPEGGGTVLLVDDDELLLMSTGALIEMLGFTLLTARDGVEALEVFRGYGGKIRCVITDLTMPRMDGWETLKALRQLDPGLPVILASGYDKGQVLSGAHTDLPQAFLGKPFGLQQLKDALGQALEVKGHLAI